MNIFIYCFSCNNILKLRNKFYLRKSYSAYTTGENTEVKHVYPDLSILTLFYWALFYYTYNSKLLTVFQNQSMASCSMLYFILECGSSNRTLSHFPKVSIWPRAFSDTLLSLFSFLCLSCLCISALGSMIPV
jgi:hypothetical protein